MKSADGDLESCKLILISYHCTELKVTMQIFVWKSSGVQMEIEYLSMIKFVHSSQKFDRFASNMSSASGSKRETWKWLWLIKHISIEWFKSICLPVEKEKKTSIKFNFGIEAEWRTHKKKYDWDANDLCVQGTCKTGIERLAVKNMAVKLAWHILFKRKWNIKADNSKQHVIIEMEPKISK